MTRYMVVDALTWLVVHVLYGVVGGLAGGLVGRVLAGKPGEKWGFLCGFPLAVAGVIAAEAIVPHKNAYEMLPIGALAAVVCGLVGGVVAALTKR